MMRLCPWEVLSSAASVVALLWLTMVYLESPEVFHILDQNPRQFSCTSTTRPCIRKCCPPGEELQQPNPNETSGCFPTPTSHFSISDVPQGHNGSKWNNDRFDVVYGNCAKYNPEKDGDIVLLLEDGTIRRNGDEVFTVASYCIDFSKDKTYIFICTVTFEESVEEITKSFVFPYIFSACSLFFTTAVYLFVFANPHIRQRLQINSTHLSVLLNYLPTLFLGYLMLIINNINLCNMNVDYPQACTLVAFIVQFSFLASFFWLNVMCFDIWLVFSDLKPVQGRKQKKFLLYSLYAWGVPMVIVAISVAMDMIPGIPDSYIKPRFGVQKCWFADNEGTLLYFYLPIAIVVVLNIIMFVSTAIKLRAHTRSTKVLNTSESRRTNENDRDRFHLYLKLFIIMGINWVMELVSFFVGGPKYVWFVTDVGNTLQGVLIFVIFVCKRRILRLLNEKLCPQWNIIRDSSTSGRSKTEKAETAKTDCK